MSLDKGLLGKEIDHRHFFYGKRPTEATSEEEARGTVSVHLRNRWTLQEWVKGGLISSMQSFSS
jgi:hypothetical protein